jgi:hypothetical protein
MVGTVQYWLVSGVCVARTKEKEKKKSQKARRLAPSAGRMEVGGYENLPVILVENFASLPGSRTRAFRLLKSPAV